MELFGLFFLVWLSPLMTQWLISSEWLLEESMLIDSARINLGFSHTRLHPSLLTRVGRALLAVESLVSWLARSWRIISRSLICTVHSISLIALFRTITSYTIILSHRGLREFWDGLDLIWSLFTFTNSSSHCSLHWSPPSAGSLLLQ